MTAPLAIATLAAEPFLPFARVLAAALARLHPQVPRYALYVDRRPPTPDLIAEAELVGLAELGVPSLESLLFRASRRELVSALKPFLLSHLLARGHRTVVFLDADQWPLAPLDALLATAERAAITLSPHRLAPPPDSGPGAAAAELRLLRAGTFNGGLLAVTNGAAARALLAWWAERLHADCSMAPEHGRHHDQRWLDLVPGCFDDVALERDPGVNVAYWNLDDRSIERRGAGWSVGGAPLSLLHFSGFDPDRPDRLSRHQPEPLDRTDSAAELLGAYAAAVRAAKRGEPDEDTVPPYFDPCFDDGTPIPLLARRLLGELEANGTRFASPLAAGGDASYLAWLRSPIDAGTPPICRLWPAVWADRLDLRRAFADPFGADRAAFVAWIERHGLAEHAIDSTFAPSAAPGTAR